MSPLTCFLCWLPFSSSAFLGGSSRALLTVRSSREGRIGRNCHRRLFLVPETTVFVAAAVAVAEVMRDDSGFMDFFRNGGADVVTITGIVCLLNANLGDRIASDMDACIADFKASSEKLVAEFKASMDELATELKVSMAEISGKTEASLEKLSGAESITVLTVTPEVSVDKLSAKTEVGMGEGELAAKTKVLRSGTDAGLVFLPSDIRELCTQEE